MARETNFYLGLGKGLRQVVKKSKGRDQIRIGEAIRRLREEAGLSGAELCRRSGTLDPRTLTAIEKGRIRNPSLESLQGIAQGLGCLVRDFFTRAEMGLGQNFHLGSPKGVFQMEFPKLGLKLVSSTPVIPQFFCGKLILAPRRKVTGEILKRPSPVFVEVVIGRVELEVEENRIVLREGENLFFNAGLKHFFRNLLNRESTLWFVTAPSFF